MEIGTLAMSDAQGIALDAMRQVGSYASRLQEVSLVGVVCKVVVAKLERCMFPRKFQEGHRYRSCNSPDCATCQVGVYNGVDN